MRPLSEQLRPKAFKEIFGQEHLVGKDGFITRLIEKQTPLSILLWGPPGCGKTSIAHLYARAFSMNFITLSAVFSGIADLKKIVHDAKNEPLLKRQTLLFVDEIHRFNKAQQDAFLPFLEDGTFILVGATTENPSFHLNSALLSRLRVLTLNPLNEAALGEMINRYQIKNPEFALDEAAQKEIVSLAQGDGRYLFNLIENLAVAAKEEMVTPELLYRMLQKKAPVFDRTGENHYNLISALHKSVRGSDPDAALYWFCRMLEGGEDPMFLARRLIRMASEDVGLADPQALPIAIAARDAFQMLGPPEGELALAEVVVYLSLAPKSNSIYTAYKQCRAHAAETTHFSPPATILNAPTKLMKELGYGKEYQYDHDTEKGFSGQHYFPEQMERTSYYQPVERGFEREMKKRIDYFQKLRNQLNS